MKMKLEIKFDNRTFEILDGDRTIAYGDMSNEDDFSEMVVDIYKYAYELGEKEGIKDYILDEEMYNRDRNQSLGLD